MRYDHRPRKSTLTADEADRVRGIGIVIPPPKRRNLYDVRPAKHAKQNREVTVTTADGRVRVLNSRLRTPGRHRTVVKDAPIRKRTQFAIGAQYGETWQTTHAPANETKQAREYWFRGVKYDSQLAIEAYIAAGCPT